MIWSESEDARAKALIACIIDGYAGGDVNPGLNFLMTDVDDWEALSLELAGHCATMIIVLSKVLNVDPYDLFERYIRTGKT